MPERPRDHHANQYRHQSLSFDTIITDHCDRASTDAHFAKMHREYGDGPQDAAIDAIRAGKPALVSDDGDGEIIEIRDA